MEIILLAFGATTDQLWSDPMENPNSLTVQHVERYQKSYFYQQVHACVYAIESAGPYAFSV